MEYFTKNLVDAFFNYLEAADMNVGEAKLPEYLDEEDEGVPPAMFASIPDQGEVYWRTIPSTVSSADINTLCSELGISELPPCLNEYFGYKHILRSEAVFLPSFPSDNPFAVLKEQATSWLPLITSGFLPYTFREDGLGPVCIDLNTKEQCQIVYFYADQLWKLGEKGCHVRERVLPLANVITDNFAMKMLDIAKKYESLIALK